LLIHERIDAQFVLLDMRIGDGAKAVLLEDCRIVGRNLMSVTNRVTIDDGLVVPLLRCSSQRGEENLLGFGTIYRVDYVIADERHDGDNEVLAAIKGSHSNLAGRAREVPEFHS
jgi:hypothetical protein